MRGMEISIAEASAKFPGFRFSPTDEELIQYYLAKKLQGSDQIGVIPEVDICRHEPWDLPALAVIQSENEWFFFSPRGRKYPHGSQSKRATQYGYWKATGKERDVKSGPNVIGTKRTLVFHTGRAPRGIRTEWITHEFCTKEKPEDATVVCRLRKNREFNLNRDSTNISCCPDRDNDDGKQLSEGPSKVADSYSHSIEPIDTGSDSDGEKAGNESSSFKKSIESEEEDCFADIMEDDIVMLDKSMPPFQGTASRRLKLPTEEFELQTKVRLHEFQAEDVLIPVEKWYRVGRIKYRSVFVCVFVFLFILMSMLMLFVGLPEHV